MGSNEVLYVRSSKKKSKPNGDETSTNDDDVWDDTILIEAYDKAIHLAHNEVMKNMQNSLVKGKDNSNKMLGKHEWKIGDHCRCQYSIDNIYYEADIVDIIEDIGMCIVRYIGYENEEKVPLHKLKPSKGETNRNMQIKQALQENNAKNDVPAGKESESGRHSRTRKKKSNGKRTGKGNFRDGIGLGTGMSTTDPNFNYHIQPPLTNMTIPPPPPPHMFANLAEDVTESEAMSAMLMSWYMSGYHTGYYQGLKAARKK